MKTTSLLLTLSTFAFCSGCNSYDPVPESSCDQVVTHAKKLLKDQADPWSKMKAQCQAASDQDRGCVMVADSAADILRCSM